MDNYILISTLNDFIFCPYSIYLHNVYMETDESIYYAIPQVRGKIAHTGIDKKTYSPRNDCITALPVFSDKYGLLGKIDLFKVAEKKLIERKYQLKQIFRGQIYQLWAQYFCMQEMGYNIESLAFYEISTNKMHPIDIPTQEDEKEFSDFITKFRNYNPSDSITIIASKCQHCIYNNLCDKAEVENVYQ